MTGKQLAAATGLVASILVGCGSPAPTPEVTFASEAVRPLSEIESLVRDNIHDLYCGSQPAPDWCAHLHLVDERVDVGAHGLSLFIGVDLADSPEARSIAADVCSALAVASHDDDGEPIGYRYIGVQSARHPFVFLARCEIR